MYTPITDPDTLDTMKTLAIGQADDLKHEGDDHDGPFRVWLARCGPEDGETHRVTVERFDGRRWYTDERLHPFE